MKGAIFCLIFIIGLAAILARKGKKNESTNK